MDNGNQSQGKIGGRASETIERRNYGGRVFLYRRPFLAGVREVLVVRDGVVSEHYYGQELAPHERENVTGEMSWVGRGVFGSRLVRSGFQIVGRWSVEDWDYFNSPERQQQAGVRRHG